VGLENFDDLAEFGLAAGFLAVADDVNDAAAALINGRERKGSLQNRVVEGVNLLGDVHEASTTGTTPGIKIRINGVAVDGGATGQRAAIDGNTHLASDALGGFQYCGNAGTLRSGKAGALLRSVVVGVDGDLVVRSERALNGAQGGIHLCHDVHGHALINYKSNREREGVHGKELERLRLAIFQNLEVAEGEAGDEVVIGVLDGDGNFDEAGADRNCILHILLEFCGSRHIRSRVCVGGWTRCFGGRGLRLRSNLPLAGRDLILEIAERVLIGLGLRRRCLGHILRLLSYCCNSKKTCQNSDTCQPTSEFCHVYLHFHRTRPFTACGKEAPQVSHPMDAAALQSVWLHTETHGQSSRIGPLPACFACDKCCGLPSNMLYMRMRRFILGLAVGLLFLSGSSARAQLAPSSDAPPVSKVPPPTEDEVEMDAAVRRSVNLVTIFFTARDRKNALVPYLTREDCTYYEDKKPQTLKSFSAEADLPLTMGILLDTSGSMDRVLPLEKQAGSQFLESVLRKKDLAFLVNFDVDVDMMQDFTSSVREMEHALDKAEINTAGGNGAGGVPGIGQGPVPSQGAPKGTLLYDAVYLASREKMSSQNGRKVLILLTDGEDEGSKTTLKGAVEAAQKADVIVYVILLVDRGVWGSGLGYSGASAMAKLTSETGGRLIDVGMNGKKLQDAFDQIEQELRTQYVASYTPPRTRTDGSYHRLDVECKGDGIKVQARHGYYSVPSE